VGEEIVPGSRFQVLWIVRLECRGLKAGKRYSFRFRVPGLRLTGSVETGRQETLRNVVSDRPGNVLVWL
jgi:hypothetical protein